MKTLSKTAKASLSMLLAIVMLMSVFAAAAPAVSAAEASSAKTGATPDELAPGNIKSISIDDIKLIEDVDSGYDWYYDEEDNYCEYIAYDYRDYINGTITLKDGTKYNIEGGYVYDDEKNYIDMDLKFSDDQKQGSEWSVGNHKATVDLDGFKSEFNVAVVESPVKSLKVKDLEIRDGVDMRKTSDYYNDEYVEWMKYQYDPSYTVTLKDSSKLESDMYGDVKIFGRPYSPNYTDDQKYENQWVVGGHKVKAELLGVSDEFTVTVNPTPIKSVEVKDITLYQNLNQYKTSTYDGEELHYWDIYSYIPLYTVTLTDGTVIESDTTGYIMYDGLMYSLDYDDGQTFEHQWDLGEHKVKAKIFNVETGFTVTVKENPVKSISVEDIDLYKDIDIDQIYRGEDVFDGYYYNPQFAVTLKDGTVIDSTDSYVMIYGEKYYPEYNDDQTPDNSWGEGEHKATITFAGLSKDLKVTVYDNPVAKITPKDITVTQGINTTHKYDKDDNVYSGIDIETECEVTFHNGKTVKTDGIGGFIFKGQSFYLDYTCDETSDNLWGEGVHTATASYGDVKADYKVTVLPTPAAKLEVDDISVYEDADKKVYAGEDDNGIIYHYYYNPTFRVTMKDGTVLDAGYLSYIDRNCAYYDGGNYVLTFNDDQSKNPWTVGKHTVTAEVLGVKTTFTVNVVPNPVKSVSVGDFKLIENAGGYYTDDEDNNHYFYYDIRTLPYTVTFKDGTVKTSNGEGLEYDGKIYYINLDEIKQDYANPLKAGDKTTISGTFMGSPFTANVEIIASPVKSVEVQPVTLIEGVDNDIVWDYNAEEYYDCYYISPTLEYTVTLADGTVLKSDIESVVYDGVSYNIEFIETGQNAKNTWTAGNTYKVSASVMGKETTFEANIIKTPVVSASVDDIYLVENQDGFYSAVEEEIFFLYQASPSKYTITLKDGTVLSADNGYVEYLGRRFDSSYFVSDQSAKNAWTVGNVYKAKTTILGFEADVFVHIVKSTSDIPDPSVTPENGGSSSSSDSNSNSGTSSSDSKVTPTTSDTATKAAAKKANTIKVKAKKKTVKASKLKNKKLTVKAITVKKAKGKVSYKKLSGSKNLKLNTKTGKITIKKGTKKGTYKIKVRVRAKGNASFKAKSKTVTVKIKVK